MFKDYNMNQLFLPLEIKLQENDIAFHVHHLVESIPYEAVDSFIRKEGCPAYHPRMMLKISYVLIRNLFFQGEKSKLY